MDATELPPTPNPDVSPPQVVVVVGWLMTATAVVATGTRIGTKISLKRLLDVDDYLCIIATVSLESMNRMASKLLIQCRSLGLPKWLLRSCRRDFL